MRNKKIPELFARGFFIYTVFVSKNDSCRRIIYVIRYSRLLLLGSGIAFAAVYRSVVRGLEGNLCFLATLCTSGCKELSGSLACVLSCVTAGFASLGLVLEAAFCIEFLFTCGENEFCAAILTNQSLVFVHADFTSLEINIFPLFPRFLLNYAFELGPYALNRVVHAFYVLTQPFADFCVRFIRKIQFEDLGFQRRERFE